MGSLSIGPGGIAQQGQHGCSNNNFLADQGNPLGSLLETVTEQRITALTRLRYPSMAKSIDPHMPMRPVTSSRIDGNKTYNTSVAYENLLNSAGVIDITPSTAAYNNPRQLLTSCGSIREKDIASRANANAEACNPVIDGPLPHVGREEYGRRAYANRLPLPPMCFMDYVNKEAFHMHLAAILDAAQDALVTLWAADRLRWIIANSRYNVAPVQQSGANGKARLPTDPSLFTGFTFGRMPEHYGTADWFATMLRQTEIDPRLPLTVHLPVAIFRKYKEQLIQQIGINIQSGAADLTSAVNGFTRNIQGEALIYQDDIYGRVITFQATTDPIYVEVKETTTGGGEWRFQENIIHRDSETAGQVMARNNPNWGVACACPNSVLAAIISVSATGDTPFAMEPLPNDNPATQLNSLIDQYARGKGGSVNTTLGQVYPSAVETVIFTGMEAQVWMLDPINQRYRDAGANCNVASNVEGTWIGGYTKIGGQFVEVKPRSLVNFMLRMPVTESCADIFSSCEVFQAVDEAGAFDAQTDPHIKQTVTVPEPVAAPEPEAGALFVVGKTTTVTAPCTGTKTISIQVIRKGGSAGALSLTVAGVETEHGGTVPGTVEFADGQTVALLEWEIPAWTCAVSGVQTSESFTLTFSGDLGEGAFTTRKICIKCAVSCPAECEVGTSGCASCG